MPSVCARIYPASDLFRIVRDDDGLQIDFMASVHRIRSLASLRSRARTIMFEDSKLLVAALSDVIRSKRAAGRPRDNAVLQILEKALREEEYKQKGETRSVKEGK